MRIKPLSAAALLLTSSLTLAQSYQFEVGVNATHYDPKHGGSDTQLGAYGEYHFTRVQTANRPLAEAGFLQRSSNIYAFAHQDLDVLQAGAEFYIPNSIFYVAAEVIRVDLPGQPRNNDWGVRLGLTPIEGLLVWTSYYDEPGYDANIHAKYVMDLGHLNYLNIEAGFHDYDHDNSYYLFSDFYFNPTFSAGVGYNDWGDDDGFTIRTRKFFNPTIAGEASFTKLDSGNALLVGASLRF